MKKIVYEITAILLLVSILTLALNIQQAGSSEPPAIEWSQTYGGMNDDAYHNAWVVQTNDGGYACASNTRSFGVVDRDGWLVKVDETGNLQWHTMYKNAGDDWFVFMIQTSDGGYLLVGHTIGAGVWDGWMVKTDANGNEIWNKRYGVPGRQELFSVVEASDGGYVAVGYAGPSSGGPFDVWLIKTDVNGNMQWSQTYGGTTTNDYGYSLVRANDGGYAIASQTPDSFGYADFWLLKVDSLGNHEWNKTYGGTNGEVPLCVVQTNDGGYAMTGYSWSFGAGGVEFLLVKTDATGNLQWINSYGGTKDDHARCVVQTGDGGFAIAGATGSFGAGDDDFLLVKVDSLGNHEWNKTYGGTSEDWGCSLLQTNDGGYAVVGWTYSFGAGNSDMWLIKLAPAKISATLDIDPDTLNLKSNGQWITAYITLPDSHSVEDIVLETVYLDGIPAAWSEIQDDVYMAKFDRATVQASLTNEPDYASAPKFYDMTLAITGTLVDGTPFEGSDMIRVLSK